MLSREEIREAVADPEWQRFRISLLGSSLQMKLCKLMVYLHTQGYTRPAQVRVANYINALKRGGLLK
jgi:hypothetical protein